MIRRLRVKGYKSLVDCDVRLDPLTVVIGPNGAGKSNLLDLIGLLSRLARCETVREAFQGHRGRPLEAFHSRDGFGAAAYERILAGGRRSFTVVCDLELNAGIVHDVNRSLEDREKATGAETSYTRVTERLLRYSLELAIEPRTGELFVADERLEALTRTLQPRAARKPFIERESCDGRTQFTARVERQSHPRWFERDRQRTLISELSDPVYHPHIVAAAREMASWRVYYVEAAPMRGEVTVQAADEPGRHGELLAPYYFGLQQRHPGTFRGVVANLREFVPGLSDLRVEVREGLLELVAVMEDGHEFPARLLSEGTLRLLCVVGIAAAPRAPAVIVYEEPENGVNPARIDLIAQILRTATSVRTNPMQVIVTTHSVAVCEALWEWIVICRWTPSGGTTFQSPGWSADDLYFQSEVRRALDEATARTRNRQPSQVAES